MPKAVRVVRKQYSSTHTHQANDVNEQRNSIANGGKHMLNNVILFYSM